MGSYRRLAVAIGILLLVLILNGCSTESVDTVVGEAINPNSPDLSAKSESVNELNVETFCSPTKIRTSVARLTWETTPDFIERQQIEVTVFKQGFEKGIYGTVFSIESQGKLQPPELKESDLIALEPVLKLRIEDVKYNEETREVSVDVEGLEPRLIYYWRLITLSDDGRVPGNIVHVEAPICVADMKDEE